MVEGGSSRDFASVKGWAYGDPDGFQRLIDVLVEATGRYLLAQVEAGAEALQLFDSWAGVLPGPQFDRWVTAPTRAIVERVKAVRPEVPIIGFPRGAGPMYRRYLEGSRVDALGLDTAVPVDWAAETLQTLVPVQGNLDPRMVVVGGAALEAETRRIVEALSGGPFVFNLGHGVVPETPPEHVAALCELLRGGTGGG
jgi:uroporphyrinogen decarboxylase